MTQEEKDLALRIFEKAMEDKENLNLYASFAIKSVVAARSIYNAIIMTEENDLAEEEKAREAFIEDEKKRKEERKLELRERKKNAIHYIFYCCLELGGQKTYSANVSSMTQDEKIAMRSRFNLRDKIKEASAFMISKEDAARLASKYRKKNYNLNTRMLECSCKDDFFKYVRECPSAVRVDLTRYGIPNEIFIQ